MRILTLTALLGALACATADPGRDAQGTTTAVTSDHRLASEAAMAVLEHGGNAMDAAITAAGVLAVARPHMNGVGGDLFLLYYDAATQRTYGLNASGRAGARATIAAVRQVVGDTESFPETGPLSVSVPGAVSGWAAALARFGSISFADALEPAARLARAGLPISERLALDIAEEREKLAAEPEAAGIYLAEGTVLRQDDLAATLDRLRANGPDELYRGETGRRLVTYLTERGGFLTQDDLAHHRAEWVEPITLGYRGLTVAAMPPNTQGVMLLEALALIERFDVAALGHNTSDYFHVLAEALRIAVTDRDSSIADPAAMRVTVGQLLALERIASLSATIDPTGRAPGADVTAAADHPNTVYVSVVDSAGNAVSLIQSLFHAFGSGLIVPGTGVILHNRGSLYALDPAHPNALAPGRLPYHTLTPAMALRDGRPWLVFGTPGGDGQVHTLAQVLNNMLVFGMTPQEAIDAPRLRRLPSGGLSIEDRVPATVLDALRARGYNVRARAGWTAEFGGAQAILVTPEGLRAGADRRREAWALAR
ncbi:MAG: gamma-glutamyltransferase [Gemmatimonadales bacterium]